MTPAMTASSPTPQPTARFWQRRLIQPVTRQLTQGVSPGQVTFTLALGTVCSLFPFWGFTWLLNLLVGLPLKLNQPILQTLNQLLTPVQLVMILGYVRLGEWIWGADEHRFSVAELVTSFTDLSIGEFLAQFGWAGIHAFTAWMATAPLLFLLAFGCLRPVIRRWTRTQQPGGTP